MKMTNGHLEEEMKDQEKKKIRKEIKERKRKLSQETKEKSDQEILQQVIRLKELESADTVFCYVGTCEEINTTPLLEYILKIGKTLCVPRCVSKGVMRAYEIDSLEQLESGRYGIKEPVIQCEHVPKEEIDLAIVPCVTCNLSGERLGYGGGYYDRFLKDTEMTKVILCREQLLTDSIPIDEHDIRMDIVVTEYLSTYTKEYFSNKEMNNMYY